ncbi:MAG: nucleotidyltransferase domain-containing protein [Parasporobacterium sp.]|nr:nucleotidyltransferase domain-containing protein [Parasporobacterium sp.]
MTTVDSIKETLEPVFKSYHVKKAILFGSFAKGTAKDNSDIDIFVDSGLKGLQFFGLLEDVTTSLNRSVDLIDSSQVQKDSKVMREINKTGITIYG